MSGRRAELKRETKETTVDLSLVVDGQGVCSIATGIPFFDHMLEQLGKHAGFDLTIDARGDLDVDLHHTVEPVAEWIGTFDPQLAEEFWKGFVDGARVTLHLRSLSGKNGHHVIEASFKGVARSLRDAVRIEGDDVPSTKGTLTG